MSRINTNVTSLIAQQNLAKNNASLNTSLERLSTGLKINSGADDPAGLIASQNLASETAGISTAIDNANRASNIIGTAEGGLSEVSNLITELQGLVSQTANSGGLSADEVQANQLQVDSIVNTINRIAQSTSFQGKQLLNGNYDYTTSAVASTAFDDLQVNAAAIPEKGSVTVAVHVNASAQNAELAYTGGTIGASGVTIAIAGNQGTQDLSFTSGTTISSIATSINAIVAETGASATISGNALKIQSIALGSDQFVSVKAISGSFATSGGSSGRAIGADAKVTVNGSVADADGTEITYRNAGLDIAFSLHGSFNTTGANSEFYITGGGATFALGSKVTEANKASIGIGTVAAGNLGSATLGYLSSLTSGGKNSLTSNNLDQAQKIVDSANTQVATLNGRLGAFQKYTIGSTVDSLGIALENASAAESDIRDTDFASETANLTRAQILSQSASTVLAQANAAPEQALTLLRGGS